MRLLITRNVSHNCVNKVNDWNPSKDPIYLPFNKFRVFIIRFSEKKKVWWNLFKLRRVCFIVWIASSTTYNINLKELRKLGWFPFPIFDGVFSFLITQRSRLLLQGLRPYNAHQVNRAPLEINQIRLNFKRYWTGNYLANNGNENEPSQNGEGNLTVFAIDHWGAMLEDVCLNFASSHAPERFLP